MREPAVYIMANRRNGTLYTGVTSDLSRRVFEHRQGRVRGFTARYGCKLLVWYERYEMMIDAIAREKQLKAGSRQQKLALIESMNPQWCDLYEELAPLTGTVIASQRRSNPGVAGRAFADAEARLLGCFAARAMTARGLSRPTSVAI